ncbi:unnamed protein product [Closterium sp. Naga37s-1]|nr:unnamed protein product [Closterium sp. Naga37s-1]
MRLSSGGGGGTSQRGNVAVLGSAEREGGGIAGPGGGGMRVGGTEQGTGGAGEAGGLGFVLQGPQESAWVEMDPLMSDPLVSDPFGEEELGFECEVEEPQQQSAWAEGGAGFASEEEFEDFVREASDFSAQAAALRIGLIALMDEESPSAASAAASSAAAGAAAGAASAAATSGPETTAAASAPIPPAFAAGKAAAAALAPAAATLAPAASVAPVAAAGGERPVVPAQVLDPLGKPAAGRFSGEYSGFETSQNYDDPGGYSAYAGYGGYSGYGSGYGASNTANAANGANGAAAASVNGGDGGSSSSSGYAASSLADSLHPVTERPDRPDRLDKPDMPLCTLPRVEGASGACCARGPSCPFPHGDLCPHCGRYCLHPARPTVSVFEREEHMKECLRLQRKVQALKLSSEIECSVCLERVLGKAFISSCLILFSTHSPTHPPNHPQEEREEHMKECLRLQRKVQALKLRAGGAHEGMFAVAEEGAGAEAEFRDREREEHMKECLRLQRKVQALKLRAGGAHEGMFAAAEEGAGAEAEFRDREREEHMKECLRLQRKVQALKLRAGGAHEGMFAAAEEGAGAEAEFRDREREEHMKECLRLQRKVQALKLSSEIECSVCLERVLGKARPADRKFGILSHCDHPFCVACIRNWRAAGQESGESVPLDLDNAVRACPLCRVRSHFVTPSVVWFFSEEEKQAIIEGYKRKLKSTDCRYFNYGNGQCPFGTSCFYKHAYRDGRLEEVKLRHLSSADGSAVISRDISDAGTIDFEIIGPHNLKLYSAKRKSEDNFQFRSMYSGDYSFCMDNTDHMAATVQLSYHIGHKPHTHEVAKDEHMQGVLDPTHHSSLSST